MRNLSPSIEDKGSQRSSIKTFRNRPSVTFKPPTKVEMYTEILEELYMRMNEDTYQAKRVSHIDKLCEPFMLETNRVRRMDKHHDFYFEAT